MNADNDRCINLQEGEWSQNDNNVFESESKD